MAVHTQTHYAALPLEDFVEDVLNKARKGKHLTAEDLADRTNLSLAQVTQLLAGDFSFPGATSALQKLAFSLNLAPKALEQLHLNQWTPAPIPTLEGLAMFTTPFSDMTVNAFLVWDPETKEAATFDTGSTCQPMLDFAQERGLTFKKHFITHTHMDHLADLDHLLATSQAPGYGSAIENPLGLKPLQHQDGLTLGNHITIRVLGTAGHTPGGLSYFVSGLATPLVVVGDALFAGSMGGAAYAYEQALQNNRQHLLNLPPETLICPGHGPMTTVGQECQHNPFYAL